MSSANKRNLQLLQHHQSMQACRACENMIPPVITGEAVMSPILSVGQAPGVHEGRADINQPFGWTAGKMLFNWFERIGMSEAQYRSSVYMSAVCRCFPGKKLNKQGQAVGGDRVPSKAEMQRCFQWLGAEIDMLAPQLIIPIGKLAINQFVTIDRLDEVVGQVLNVEVEGLQKQHKVDVIALPHPSGASTWQHTEPGKTLLSEALGALQAHPAWQACLATELS